MKRRQILKAMLLAPFVGLINKVVQAEPKERKKLNVKVKIGETITVPNGQKWEVYNIKVYSPTRGRIATTSTTCDLTYEINGYIV